MTEKYLNIDIEDPRSGKIAEVLSNKTSKKILGLLAEGERSASEISEKLDLPLNTVTYNMEKLVSSGLVEEVKGFLWSVKGKRIKRYKVSNRKIIISPKKMASGIIPLILCSGIVAGAVKMWMNYSLSISLGEIADKAVASAPSAEGMLYAAAPAVADNAAKVSLFSGVWIWAAGGILLGFLAYIIWRYSQKGKNERRFN